MNPFLENAVLVPLVLLAVFFIWFGPAAWAIGDAQKRGKSGGLVVLLFCFFGPCSAAVWLLFRPKERLVDRSHDYSNAEDALAAASRLDQLGEWDAAIELYEKTRKCWPEHAVYVNNCIQNTKQKQSLG